MSPIYLRTDGVSVRLGSQVGSGGEGDVFAIDGSKSLVAKIYNSNHKPDTLKQNKLRFMARICSQKICEFTAWPNECVHGSPGGDIVGFLMQNVKDRIPIFKLYSPAQRKQTLPNATWDFIVMTARNVAAAFDEIHKGGHVIGDVNQSNLMVGTDSRVILIDTDSFQINVDGVLHFCKVATPHFTAPELQRVQSFNATLRTANHDNFGLALLVFHLLFCGRHPYAGVPANENVGDSLESNIAAFRYAYAPDAKKRSISPPPNSISIELVPEEIRSMFVSAFTEPGSVGTRPTALHWTNALEKLAKNLSKCSVARSHLFSNHLSKCPWCELEQFNVVYFPRSLEHSNGSPVSNYKINDLIIEFSRIIRPQSIQPPNLAIINVIAKPILFRIDWRWARKPVMFSVIGCALLAIYLLGANRLLSELTFGGVLFISLIAYFFVERKLEEPYKNETESRAKRKEAAEKIHESLLQITQRDFAEKLSDFNKKLSEVNKLLDGLKNLDRDEMADLVSLRHAARSRRLNEFLERFFIEDIPGLWDSKKAALRSFGIETAADVTEEKVRAVYGFGPVLTATVVRWRKSCEASFIFDPTRALSALELNNVKIRTNARKVALESTFLKELNIIKPWSKTLLEERQRLDAQLKESALELASAIADLRVMGSQRV